MVGRRVAKLTLDINLLVAGHPDVLLRELVLQISPLVLRQQIAFVNVNPFRRNAAATEKLDLLSLTVLQSRRPRQSVQVILVESFLRNRDPAPVACRIGK